MRRRPARRRHDCRRRPRPAADRHGGAPTPAKPPSTRKSPRAARANRRAWSAAPRARAPRRAPPRRLLAFFLKDRGCRRKGGLLRSLSFSRRGSRDAIVDIALQWKIAGANWRASYGFASFPLTPVMGVQCARFFAIDSRELARCAW